MGKKGKKSKLSLPYSVVCYFSFEQLCLGIWATWNKLRIHSAELGPTTVMRSKKPVQGSGSELSLKAKAKRTVKEGLNSEF